jgi:hypothetical protein
MSKLKLAIDNLAVESFDTCSVPKEKGTVFGEQCTCQTVCTCPGCPTCDQTCPQTCDDYSCAWSCNGTCAGTCYDTCGLTCPETCRPRLCGV